MNRKNFYDWCIDNNRQDLIDAWNKEKNGDIKNTKISERTIYYFTINNKYEDIKGIIPDIITRKGSDPFYKYNNSLGLYIINNFEEDYLNRIWSEQNNISPFEITKGSEKELFFKCIEKDYHPDYISTPSKIINGNRCPYCAHKIIHPLDSFAQYHIDNTDKDFLLKYWDEKNIINPYNIPPFQNNKHIYIKCQNIPYHIYKTTPSNFSMGHRCPYCNHISEKVHYLDSLGSIYPEINNIWSSKNKMTPYDLRCKSHKKIWLKCSAGKHADYQRKVSDYINNKARHCPECTKERTRSYIEEKVYDYITQELGFDVNCEYNCSLIAINPLTKYKLPYDNEVVELKLIIEVHGIQHYQESGWHITQSKNSKRDIHSEFVYQQQKDEYKKQYAISKGYEYLEIPYWTIDNDDYKILINNKINEIKVSTVETAG